MILDMANTDIANAWHGHVQVMALGWPWQGTAMAWHHVAIAMAVDMAMRHGVARPWLWPWPWHGHAWSYWPGAGKRRNF